MSQVVHDTQLSIGSHFAKDLVVTFGSPLYVYDASVIRQRLRTLREAVTYPLTDLHYACKANSNLSILRLLRDEGACIDAVSPGEIFLALKAGFTADQILFTGNSVTNDEMRFLLDRDILINIDSLSQLERYGRLAPGTQVSLRINPDVGSGHHDHCITAGPESKFGIVLEHLVETQSLIDRYGLTVVGLHMHVGSGILDPAPFLQAVEALLGAVPYFEHLTSVNFGGGLGIVNHPDETELDIQAFGAQLSDRFRAFCDGYGARLRFKLEPGRYIVGESGTLLTRCSTIKTTRERTFAGTDSGFNHLIRHSLYESYHEVANATNMNDEAVTYDVSGNICESADFFARERRISRIREGDILAVRNAGAYGFCMSSNYNTRPRPAEVLVDGEQVRLIRRRETLEDLVRGQE